MGASAAKAGEDIVKAPSRLIRSLRSDDDGQTPSPKPGAGGGEPLFGDGALGRVRSTPLRPVAIAAGGLLVIGWLAWAVYVASENGASAGLGVVIAVPALFCLVALPLAGLTLLVRRLRSDEDHDADASEESEAEEARSG
jgi:hypothetical protein